MRTASVRADRNIFKTKDGRFGVDICRRCRDDSGRLRQKRVHFIVGNSIKEARDARNREQAKFGGREFRFAPGGITFDVFAEKYLERHSSRNRSAYRDNITVKLHLGPFFRRYRLADVTTAAVLNYIDRRRGQVSYRGTPTNPATINREIALLKSMFNRALEWEDLFECEVNWRRIKKFDEYGRERTLAREEFARLIEQAERVPHLRDFIVFALNTGMRKSEILGLRWDYIDMGGRTISVPRNLRKNRRPLVVPINETLAELLSGMKRVGDYVFFNEETGDHRKDLVRSFKTACRRAGIMGFRIHDLRHTFGTALACSGEGTLAISRILGHSSEAMTRRYINRMDVKLHGAVEKLNGTFSAKRRLGDDTKAAENPATDTY